MKQFIPTTAIKVIATILLCVLFITACVSDQPETDAESAAETSESTTASEPEESQPEESEPEESEESAPAVGTRSRLVVGVPFLSEILDAQQAFDGGPMSTEQIGQALLRIDSETGELLPDLAESWAFSEDGKTMTFILPANAVYSNGDPLDAQAVGDALLRNKEVSPYASDFEALIDVNVVDPTTLELLFSDPPAAFLTVLNSSFGGPWNVAVAQEIGNEAFATAPIASGPFMVQEFTPGSELLLVRNENYQTNLPLVENQGPPHLEEVLVRMIPEELTLVGELEAGTIDLIVQVPVSAVSRLRDNPEITVFETPLAGLTGLVMNLNHPYFSDLLVRQAIAKAVDREALVKVLGGAVPVHAFISPSMVAYSAEMETYAQKLHSHDVAAAQALLAEAGWTDADGDSIVEKDNQPFVVEILVPADAIDQQQVSQILQIQLKAIGIDLQISQQDDAALREAKVAGEYEMGFEVYNWADPDILSLVFGASFWNFPQYDNPALLEEMVAARYILDTTERTAAYADIQQTLLDEVAEIPLWQNIRFVAARKNTQGIIDNGYPLFLNDVMIEP